MSPTVKTDRTVARSRRLLGVAAAAAAALVMSACAAGAPAGDDDSGGGSTGGWAGPQPIEGFESVPAPGDPIDVSSLAGKTVYWIPITTQAPIFNIEASAAKEAFEAAGVNFQVCDGKASPDAVSACVTQAINADADGIITTSIPPEFAQQSFAAAAEAGLALEFVNTPTSEVPEEWGPRVVALPFNFVEQQRVNAGIVMEDSDHQANVLLIGINDSAATTFVYENGMKAAFEEDCPDCTVSDIQAGTTTLSNLSSQVSAALTRDPGIQYIMVQFDSFAPPVVQALRELNKASSVKLLTARGDLSGLQRLADGQQFVDTGDSVAATGWNQADAMLRLLLDQQPVAENYVAPLRTFDQASVQGLDLTEEGWLSGAWTSDDDFRSMYRTLWGVN